MLEATSECDMMYGLCAVFACLTLQGQVEYIRVVNCFSIVVVSTMNFSHLSTAFHSYSPLPVMKVD